MEACDQLNMQHPGYESGWYTASHLAMMVNQPLLGVRAIDQALLLSPGKPEWLLQRVKCLGASGNVEAAIATSQKIAAHQFDRARLAADFGLALTRLGLYPEALRQYACAAELEPNDGRHYYNLAAVLRFLGDIDTALSAISRCLELSPDDEDAHLLRAGLKTQTAENNNIVALQEAHARADGQARKRVRLCYALAKELEDIGDYERSFEFLFEGSSLRRAGLEYTLQRDLDSIASVREVYNKDVFDGHIHGHVNAEPIFVIGMPRTGTTLVERILGNHSVVTSAGELRTFSTELVKHCQKLGGEKPNAPADLVSLSLGVNFEELGVDYIAATRPRTGQTAHFVDKLPLNFLYAGLIHLALPKAKIVLLERDPMDTCYAVYKTLFEDIYPFSYDLKELATYFLAYQQLIDHWQSVMPGVLHVVKYEELVTEPKPVIQNLLSYCGLSWEEGCLKYYDNDQASTTASAVQVRDEMYRSSIGKWRNFERQLAPVAEILGVNRQ
jgi:tetratricopeptide (TPR) repeat protein